MTDILGPANAAGAVTTRPADDRIFGALDSYFKDCTPGLEDGTEYRAAFFNALIDSLRVVWRVNGALAADPTTKIVAENGADNGALAKALQHLIQRGQPKYATDVGSANAMVASLSPALAEYKAGVSISVKVAYANSGAATINVNGLGAKAIVRPDGSALRAGDLVAGEVADLICDGDRFQKVGLSTAILSAPRTYYVDGANGNDANDGVSPGAGHAFATIQKAVDTARLFNQNGYDVTISIADWVGHTYAPVALGPINGSGSIRLVGNSASPQNVEISNNAGSAVVVTGAGYSLNGIRVSSSGHTASQSGCGIFCQSGNINLSNIDYGPCVDFHMFCTSGVILLDGAHKVTGSAAAHMRVGYSGIITTNVPPFSPTLTVAIAVAFSAAFAFATQGSMCGILYGAITGAGNVSGQKYVASGNSIIDTNGSGASYLPGTIGGVATTGGQYL